MSLQGVSRPRGVRTRRRNADAAPAPDLIHRGSRIDDPNKPTVADITHVSIWSGFP